MGNTRLPSWRDLAGILAERVYHSALSDPHDGAAPENGCPFCKDRLAYEAWERKSGKTHRDPPPGADLTVNVFDLVRADRAAGGAGLEAGVVVGCAGLTEAQVDQFVVATCGERGVHGPHTVRRPPAEMGHQ